MSGEIQNISSGSRVVPRSLAELLEEVRLTSLNLAVASAKFKARNIHQDKIKKDLTEVVALALESVQFLTKFLEAIGITSEARPQYLEELDHDRINKNLSQLTEYIEKITDDFLKDQGLR